MGFDAGDIPGSVIGLFFIVVEIVFSGFILDILKAFVSDGLALLLYLILLVGTGVVTILDLLDWGNLR
jgi:hypothetical protein